MKPEDIQETAVNEAAPAETKPRRKSRHIAFWICMPLGVLQIMALVLFYLDLANGPLILLPVSIALVIGLVVSSILLVNKRMGFRLIPWGALVLSLGVVFSVAKPAVRTIPAVSAYAEQTSVLAIPDGKIQGVYSEDKKVEVYAGIPFAKPPVGELRWKAPQPVTPWEGIRDCSYFAPRSMQPKSNPIIDSLVDMYAEKGWHPNYRMNPQQNMSEDSLYLNVWKPAGTKENLPVLVFFHGGSLTSGSSATADYNGESMARQDVIMVTAAYRLGVFGYFAHEELEAESLAETGHATTGNYGLLDQVQALRWVHDNIAFFGGDPTKVTIAGESAGSSSVSALCVTPLAKLGGGKTLFQRAIGESSSLIVKRAPHTFRKLKEAKETGEKIMKEQWCKSIAELRQVPASTLVQTGYSNSGMTIDGYAIIEEPFDTYQRGENNESALLNGYNVKESDAFIVPQYLFDPTNKNNIRGRLVEMFDEKTADRIMELYRDRIEEDAFTSFNAILSVFWFIQPHDSWSKAALDRGEPVYRYQFTKENGFYGTYHSGEMIYCYGNIDRSIRPFAYDESDRALSKTMLGYWANFAKTGDPNGSGLPTWPTYVSGGEVMELGARVGLKADVYKGLYPIIEDYIDEQIEKENAEA